MQLNLSLVHAMWSSGLVLHVTEALIQQLTAFRGKIRRRGAHVRAFHLVVRRPAEWGLLTVIGMRHMTCIYPPHSSTQCASVCSLRGAYTGNQFNNLIRSRSKNGTDTVLQSLPRARTQLTEVCLFLSLTSAQNKVYGSPQPLPPGTCDHAIAVILISQWKKLVLLERACFFF